MYKEQLRWSIFSVLWRLLLAHPAAVPDVDSANTHKANTNNTTNPRSTPTLQQAKHNNTQTEIHKITNSKDCTDLLSAPHDARMVSLKGAHATVRICSVWLSNECSLWPRLRKSHRPTLLSALPV